MLIYKGLIIGLAKIIPGVSGSLVALNLGLYEKGINSICNFFKDVKNNIIFLSNVGIGILISIIFGSKLIDFLLNKYYFLTMLSFIGLLWGSNMSFFKCNCNRYTIVTFVITLSLFFIKTNLNYVYEDNIINNMYVALLGFIDASFMIIPGVSGTVIFIIMGCYEFILSIFSNMFSNIKIIVFFTIGLVIGIIIISKLVNYLLIERKKLTFSIISGFFLSSMIYLIINTFKSSYSFKDIILSIPILAFSYKVGTYSKE